MAHRVLVVDDDIAVAETIQRTLSLAGHDAQVAHRGADELFAQLLAGPLEVDGERAGGLRGARLLRFGLGGLAAFAGRVRRGLARLRRGRVVALGRQALRLDQHPVCGLHRPVDGHERRVLAPELLDGLRHHLVGDLRGLGLERDARQVGQRDLGVELGVDLEAVVLAPDGVVGVEVRADGEELVLLHRRLEVGVDELLLDLLGQRVLADALHEHAARHAAGTEAGDLDAAGEVGDDLLEGGVDLFRRHRYPDGRLDRLLVDQLGPHGSPPGPCGPRSKGSGKLRWACRSWCEERDLNPHG